MSEIKFIGARLGPETAKILEDTAKEEKIDKSTALKELIIFGRQKILEKRAVEQYRDGRISTDKAAEMLSTTVTEIMRLFVSAGIKSEETMEEYSAGLKLLLNA